METLPADSQLALSLFYMGDKSIKEVASFMGISPTYVKVKLHRARKRLGEKLEKMLGRQLEQKKLRPGFTFTLVDAIRNMPTPSAPKPSSIRNVPLPISIGVALLIGIIGFGISSGIDVSQDMPGIKSVQTPFPVSLAPIRDASEQRIVALQKKQNEEIKSARKSSLRYGNDKTTGGRIMSKIISSAAIRDAHQIVSRAEKAVKEATEQFGSEKRVEFPKTAYFLPVIYAMTGMEMRTIADMHPVLDKAKMLLPPVPAEKTWLPSLGNTLDAGMATLFASEIIEVLKYLEAPVPYYIGENCPDEGDNYWLGAADDFVYRKRGLNFVDGDCLGFVTIVGCAPTNEIAVKIARELQEKKLYVFMTATADGKNMAEQLRQEGVQMGWDTRLVPFGKDITARVYPLGFFARMAMAWGGAQPGDYWRILLYIKNRTLIRLVANKETDLESLITDTFEFADYERVLNLLEHRKDEAPYGLGPLLYNVGERFSLL